MLGQFNPAVKHPENFLPEESTHYTSPLPSTPRVPQTVFLP